jgi:transposase InsO family protein
MHTANGLRLFQPNQTISPATIKILREICSRFGLPSILISDNGSNFRSCKFEDFCKTNGIHHKYSAPFHPVENGQAKRFVQIMKQSLRATENEHQILSISIDFSCSIVLHHTPQLNVVQPSRLNIMRSNIQQEMNLNNFETPKKTSSYVKEQPVQIRFYNSPC